MHAILDPIEFTAPSDGQRYSAVFEHFFNQSPNRCEIFIDGYKIGEATWYDEGGLMDRFPEGIPIKAWNEVCDRIEHEVEYRIDGHKRAMRMPTFWPAEGDEPLIYKQGTWVGIKHSFGAAKVTGHPIDANGDMIKGTYVHND